LNTVLVSIEATIKSRPLLQTVDSTTLTPAHFLHGQKLTTIPTGPEPPPSKDLKREYRPQQQAADDFWKRWTKEYLLELRFYHHVRRTRGEIANFCVDLALLKDEVHPRHMWKRGLIEELRPGRDGRVRTVILRTPEGNQISRPVQLVMPLEIDQGWEDVEG
jgi:hypothetical protein